MSTERPVAFIAMKFTAEHWKDQRYLAIRDVLEGAGYDCIRGDEIRSSGPVVDEICRLLREADLVVLDSSDNSHSVSYEIGYCHGVNRDPNTTLLLSNSAEIPFNYRHFRSRIFKDTRSLKRLLRDFLSLSEPICDDQYGYTFTFSFSENAVMGYIMDGAECLFDGLKELDFSGRCECYSGEHFFTKDRSFSVALAIRDRAKRETPTYEYWQDLLTRAERHAQSFSDRIKIDYMGCELSRKSAIKHAFVYCGSAEWVRGKIVRIIDSSEGETFYDSYLERKKTDT